MREHAKALRHTSSLAFRPPCQVLAPPKVMSNMMSGVLFSSTPELKISILILRCSGCPQCQPYRHTKSARVKRAKQQQSLVHTCHTESCHTAVQNPTGTSCKGINSLRCQRQIQLASSTMVDNTVYLVLVLLINSFCRVFLPCIHLHSMQNLNFLIARHALTVTGNLYLKAISS